MVALPGRENIVLSRNPDFAPPGVVVVPTLERALAHCAGHPRVFVIGGAQIFREALPLATGIILSVLDQVSTATPFSPHSIPRSFRRQRVSDTPEAAVHRHHLPPGQPLTFARPR